MNNTTLYIRSLIIADISGSITPEEKAYLNSLIEEWPEIREMSDYLHLKVDKDTLRKEALQRVKDLVISRRAARKVRRIRITAVATAACLVGCVSLLLFQNNKYDQPEISLAEGQQVVLTIKKDIIQLSGSAINIDHKGRLEYNNKIYQLSDATIHVPIGRVYQVNTADSSSILLNGHSRFTLPESFDNKELDFSLKGEAYVNIVKKAERVVTIHLPNSTVKVLGTEFNVKGNEAESVTSLVSGSVAVTSRNSTITLRPDYQVICNQKMEVQKVDADSAISWAKPVSTLSNPSGTDIEKTFLKCYGVKLNISPSGQRNYLTLAMDRREPPEEFLQRCINMYPDLTYYYNNGAYYLK